MGESFLKYIFFVHSGYIFNFIAMVTHIKHYLIKLALSNISLRRVISAVIDNMLIAISTFIS